MLAIYETLFYCGTAHNRLRKIGSQENELRTSFMPLIRSLRG